MTWNVNEDIKVKAKDCYSIYTFFLKINEKYMFT